MCCFICTEYELGKLTIKEAMVNIGEALISNDDEDDRDHLFDLSNRILDADLKIETEE